MNKKIYYNDKFIEFGDQSTQFTDNQLLDIIPELEEKDQRVEKILTDFLDEKSRKSYRLINWDFGKFFDKFRRKTKYIEAAGGVIEKEGQFLFIFRHRRWDLPKGKREKNEAIEDCALRECEEECGISGLSIVKQLSSTWHVYPHKGSHALKQTFWFHMRSTYSGQLVPQLEEDITEVRWFNREQINEIALSNTYYTISDVIKESLNR